MIALLVLLSGVAAPDTVRVVKDVDYVDGQEYKNRKDRLDLYLPEGAKDVPVVVFFHGGGLRQGDKSDCEHVGRALARQGVGAAIANYRLSPTVSHPAHVEDGARSVAWVRRHIEEYGGNPDRVFLAGHSAGAYLVSLLSTDARYLKAQGLSTKDLAGVVPISGFFWVEKVAPDRPKDTWGADPKLWPDASPAKYVSADAPPTLLLYADGDDPWRRQQNEEMAKAMKAEAVQITERDHISIFMKLGPGDPAFDRMVAFVSNRRAARWWKGNTHTHSLWSDGDAAPELAADWYKQHGYHFLVLSDHNVQLEGERWVKVGTGNGEASPAQVQALVERFGAKEVEWREREGGKELRLRTLPELRERFEDKGFLFIQGEEITDAIGPKRAPLHHNSMNHSHLISPVGGDSMREAMEKTVAAVAEASKRSGKPMLVHLNHPNFHWAVTPDDVAHVLGERYFEVYNGHRGVRNHGDAVHAGTEAIWDYVLTLRLSKLGGDVLYGLATDDAHHYHQQGATATPGRGWIWVRSEQLTADAIVRAMQAGDFYASSGVKLEDVVATQESLGVRVAAEEGLTYVTKFIGTRTGGDVTGEVLQRSVGASADYRFQGSELYVRAVVISSRRHPNGYDPDDFETAWTQPARVAR